MLKEIVIDEEYIYFGSWCIVEDFNEDNVFLYFGSHSDFVPIDSFVENATIY